MGHARDAFWPSTPVAAALWHDGAWIRHRWAVTALAVGVGGTAPFLLHIPQVTGIPVLPHHLLLMGLLITLGLFDARAGVLAAVVAVAAAAIGHLDSVTRLPPAESWAFGVQAVVVASLSGLLALAVTELGRETTGALRRRLPRLSPWATPVIVGAIAWIAITGWFAASPVLVGSAIPWASFVDLAPSRGAAVVAGVGAAVAILRRTLANRAPTPRRALPQPRRGALVAGQVTGGVVLLLLISSLFRGAPETLAIVSVQVLAIRLVRCGLLPPPRRLLGTTVNHRLERVPPVFAMTFVLLLAAALGIGAQGDPSRIRLGLVTCLMIVLVFATDVSSRSPRPRRRLTATAVLGGALVALPLAAAPAASDDSVRHEFSWTFSDSFGGDLTWEGWYEIRNAVRTSTDDLTFELRGSVVQRRVGSVDDLTCQRIDQVLDAGPVFLIDPSLPSPVDSFVRFLLDPEHELEVTPDGFRVDPASGLTGGVELSISATEEFAGDCLVLGEYTYGPSNVVVSADLHSVTDSMVAILGPLRMSEVLTRDHDSFPVISVQTEAPPPAPPPASTPAPTEPTPDAAPVAPPERDLRASQPPVATTPIVGVSPLVGLAALVAVSGLFGAPGPHGSPLSGTGDITRDDLSPPTGPGLHEDVTLPPPPPGPPPRMPDLGPPQAPSPGRPPAPPGFGAAPVGADSAISGIPDADTTAIFDDEAESPIHPEDPDDSRA